jgi:hypothetical protein
MTRKMKRIADRDLSQINEAVFTGEIPQCPRCREGTRRALVNKWSTETMSPPLYTPEGDFFSGTITETWLCIECNKHYGIRGDKKEGFKYY